MLKSDERVDIEIMTTNGYGVIKEEYEIWWELCVKYNSLNQHLLIANCPMDM